MIHLELTEKEVCQLVYALQIQIQDGQNILDGKSNFHFQYAYLKGLEAVTEERKLLLVKLDKSFSLKDLLV